MRPNHYRPGRGYDGPRPSVPRPPPLNTNTDIYPDDVYHAQYDYRSRYNPRYEDRRSRSPRDRSPDRLTDRASQYSDGDRRRTSAESRTNASAFQSNRDTFRDPLTGREPPRAPKAYLDPPSGPRGGFSGEFRGRGRGRGRGWRDDSRDRGRDRDFRDRREDPPPFRDDRSRERDRDWRDRDRDSFRGGRRPSPGPRRSPPGRDFRDRDLQIGVEADRAGRGSRDGGPLSAGSSSSDPPFAAQSYRGSGYRGRGGRGRGDWDRGRGRPPFYDDRSDRFRSRSQEGRWGAPRERDDRDAHRYNNNNNNNNINNNNNNNNGNNNNNMDTDMRPRDLIRDDREPPLREPPRDPRDLRDPRDAVDRNVRPRIDRQGSVANEPQTTPTGKPITPPLAPVAPAFGTAPLRPPPTSDISSKAPPTAPRAFTEDRQDRPVSSGQPAGDQWAPPSGPSNPISPTIPTGPRGMQLQKAPRPSSKQWINPALVGNKGIKAPESPKTNRSQSFALPQQSRPFGSRPDSYSSRQNDEPQRPRSSGTGAESERPGPDNKLRPLTIPEPDDGRIERGTQSARTSIDRDLRAPWRFPEHKTGGVEISDRASVVSAISPTAVKTVSPTVAIPTDLQAEQDSSAQEDGEIIEGEPPKKKSRTHATRVHLSFPPRVTTIPTVDQSSDSDDDEEMNDYFDSEITKADSELQKLDNANNAVPTDIMIRYANMKHEAMVTVVTGKEGWANILGSIPEGLVLPPPKEATPEPEKIAVVETVKAETEQAPAPPVHDENQDADGDLDDEVTEPTQPAEAAMPEPQPKVEEMEVDTAHVPIPTVEYPEPHEEQGDVMMEDAPMNASDAVMSEAEPVPNGVSSHSEHLQHLLPSRVGPPATADNSPTPIEQEDETDVEVDSVALDLVRPSIRTPPIEDLPYYDTNPWTKSRQAMSSMEHNPEVEAFISRILQENSMFVKSEQQVKQQEYARNYDEYLRFTLSNDPIAIKSRDAFNKANIPADGYAGYVIGPEAKPEGRRAGRFATERDMERIMAQSLLEAREKEERETRAEKLKHPGSCEAVIPNMYWTKEDREKELYVDRSGFLNPEKLIANWQVLPPTANFTPEEAELFEKAYLEFPKQWGKIADKIPGRDYHSCIQYYYIKKKELKLKEKLKRQPKKKKSRKTNKARSSALVSELGNPDETQEEPTDTGENGERRRPRRAAAPTWDFERPQAESAEGTPVATPSGRRGGGSKADSGAEKVDKPPRRKRVPKDKEPKHPKTPQVLAPTPHGVTKGARSRSSSKVPVPELLPSQHPTADMGRTPLSFDTARASPMPALPPSIVPAPGHVVSPAEKLPLSANNAIVDVMAPPSLRPEPVMPPQSQVATFEFGHPTNSARSTVEPPERGGRATPVTQATSYWSVAELSDFPQLLRSFGTNWQSIAQHMTTKTAVMVKNFYTRKERENPEWSQIVSEADEKMSRGEKLPAPPTPTAGPRNKRSDFGTHRRAPSVDTADENAASKAEKQSAQREQSSVFNGRVPVPIAQAPVPQQLRQQAVMGQLPLAERVERVEQSERKPLVSSQPTTQSMEPVGRHARASPAYPPEREPEPISTQQQAMRHSLKTAPISQASEQPVLPSQAGPARAGFAAPEYDAHLNILGAAARQRRPPADLQPKEEPRLIERQAPRLKQEPDQGPHFEPFVPTQTPRPMSTKPVPLDRRPEPPHSTAPPQAHPQAYAPVPPHPMMQQRETMRDTLREQQMMAQPVDERRISSMPGRVPNPNFVETRVPNSGHMEDSRRMASQNMEPPRVSNNNYDTVPARVPNLSMLDTSVPPRVPNPNAETPTRGHGANIYDNAYSASPRPSPTPSLTGPPSKGPEPKKSSLMALLNNDDTPAPSPPPAPKRVDEVARGAKTSSSPPPQAMPGRGQPASAGPSYMRREGTPTFSSYSRTPVQSAMPPLKPYSTPHIQSPQSQHVSIPRSTIVSPIDFAAAREDYYDRISYRPQHQVASSGSPHQPPHHYPSPSQQSPMVYQAQQPTSYPFGAPVSQSHMSSSPSMQYAAPRGREPTRDPRDPRDPREPREYRDLRDSVPPSRETAWPAPQGQPPSAMKLQQETSWPPPKASQAPLPAQSPWGSQHGAPSKLQQVRETPQPSWSAPPPQMSLRESVARDPRDDPYAMRAGLRESVPPRDPREERYTAMLEPQRPTADPRMSGDPRMSVDPRDPRIMGHPHHQHSHSGSMSGRMYIASPAPREVIGGPPPGPPQPQTPVYPRYATPGPRDMPPARSFTPAPASQQAAQQAAYAEQLQIMRESQMRENQMRESQMRESQMRENQMRESQIMRERDMRERDMRERDMREREMRVAEDLRAMRDGMRPGLRGDEYAAAMDPRARGHPVVELRPEFGAEFRGELRGGPPQQQQQQQADLRVDPRADPLRRQLRPHEAYPPGPGDRRY